MSQTSVLGPFGVGDLGDQLRLDPVNAAANTARRCALDGWSAAFERPQARVQRFERALVEACADLAGVAERRARVVARRDEQCAEGRARAAGVGEAHDDELLPLEAFDLEPASSAFRAVGIGGALGDDALESELAGCGEKFRAVLGDVLAVADCRRRVLEQPLEQGFALDERHARQIPTVEMQQIEGNEHDLGARALVSAFCKRWKLVTPRES